MVSERWRGVVDKAKELTKAASQATKEELKRVKGELEEALEKTKDEVDEGMLNWHRRMIEARLASKEPSLLGKEVITTDGNSLGRVIDMRLDVEENKVWIVVGKKSPEAKNVSTTDVRSVGDKVILSLSSKEMEAEKE
jgi:sporulation protein YlmC with PRC-barrel domain